MALGQHVIDFFKSATVGAARTALGVGDVVSAINAGVVSAGVSTAERRAASLDVFRSFTPLSLAPLVGTTAARPTDCALGTPYFDTTLGKPVFLKTAPSTWVDSAGVTA